MRYRLFASHQRIVNELHTLSSTGEVAQVIKAQKSNIFTTENRKALWK